MAAAHARRESVLKAILAFSIVSTGLHYTHNFVEIDQYPPSDLFSDTAIQVGVLVTWPLLTAIGIIGYRLYSRRRYRQAHPCLLTYSFTGLLSFGHFIDGTPDIAPVWFATIFTDGLAGLALVAFTVWSAATVARAREAVQT